MLRHNPDGQNFGIAVGFGLLWLVTAVAMLSGCAMQPDHVRGVRVLAFGMQGCTQCEKDKPEVRRHRFIEYDLDQHSDLAESYRVRVAPTYIAINKQGEEVYRTYYVARMIAWLYRGNVWGD
jgi:hypothetical protein